MESIINEVENSLKTQAQKDSEPFNIKATLAKREETEKAISHEHSRLKGKIYEIRNNLVQGKSFHLIYGQLNYYNKVFPENILISSGTYKLQMLKTKGSILSHKSASLAAEITRMKSKIDIVENKIMVKVS